jgi:hypothetical protein
MREIAAEGERWPFEIFPLRTRGEWVRVLTCFPQAGRKQGEGICASLQWSPDPAAPAAPEVWTEVIARGLVGEGRKVAAILAADVVGYSRLTGADEEATLARKRALRRELFNPTVEAHGGRVVKRMGDGVIVEFRSVVEAVRCAIEVTKGLAKRNAGVPTDRRIEVRTGIHLGDVVEEADGDLWATASTSPRGSRGFASRAASSSRRTLGARCATNCPSPSSTSANGS